MDMARLGLSLRKNFPQQFGYFGLKEVMVAGKQITGHNKVLDMVAGQMASRPATPRIRFNLVSSVERNGRLVVAVIMGEDSAVSAISAWRSCSEPTWVAEMCLHFMPQSNCFHW